MTRMPETQSALPNCQAIQNDVSELTQAHLRKRHNYRCSDVSEDDGKDNTSEIAGGSHNAVRDEVSQYIASFSSRKRLPAHDSVVVCVQMRHHSEICAVSHLQTLFSALLCACFLGMIYLVEDSKDDLS